MIETELKILNEDQLLHGLLSIYEMIHDNGDSKNARKVVELIKKIHDQEYTIGFCGHFSAGKSSMINEIMGEEILPSSPIPTSANIVKIKSGEEYVRIYYRSGEIVEYPIPYNFDLIKSYCKNGDEIDSLEISHQTNQLPNGVTVMDTPGIDSTDDAHQKSTMSALHLTDLILYVMDYNHVQSEMNFQFTKMLKDEGRTVYLIINQIDKHREEEITFANFQQGVKQAFQNWNVHVDGIFYTSIRNKNIPNNELSQLKNIISNKIANKNESLRSSVEISVNKVIEDHRSFLEDKSSAEQQSYQKILSTLNEMEKDNVDEIVKRTEMEIQVGNAKLIQAESNFKKELESILDSAYMMPFETRELAKAFLESRMSNFKVGIFFTKTKTEQEKQERLQQFYTNLRHLLSNQLERHIQQFIVNYLKTWRISNSGLIKEAQSLKIDFDESLLENVIKRGAGLTGDYVLTYTADVANEIKRLYRNKALILFGKIKEHLEDMIKKEQSSLFARLKEYKEYQEAIQKLWDMQNLRNHIINSLQNILNGQINHSLHVSLDELLQDYFKRNIIKKESIDLTEQSIPEIKQNDNSFDYHHQEHIVHKPKLTNRITSTVSNLRKTSGLVENIKGLTAISQELMGKADRLMHQNFTVALFGAFSAGKSSFANALMGDSILPVSPNPTTATINKIVPTDEKNQHGTVKVKLKTKEQLLQDIKHSLKVFDIDVNTLEEAIRMINEKLYENHVGAKEKTHYNFLKAVGIGMSSFAESLGFILQVDLDGFKDFVAKEEKACFVEWIELYYDCPLTKKGITLVDTPGADSVNARHTGVAFEYIKNADAILFVTYYNHAFSKADREFLIQLGRVKDTFAMDKMFFIVNAADLASSHEELSGVVQYVGNQLVTYGIRKPRIYPISSQMALMEKLGKDIGNPSILETSGMDLFETEFNHFIIEELTEMAIQSAFEDMKRIIHILESYITSAKESNEIKFEKIKTLNEQQISIQTMINTHDIAIEQEAIKQEIEELVYYIKQRIFLRYPDIFKESFSSSVLRDDVANIKLALKKCLLELIEFIGNDLAQEMRATSLRIEKFMRLKLHDLFLAMLDKSKHIQKEIEFTSIQDIQFQTIEHQEGIQNIDIEDAKYKKALSVFKNAKSFFEKNEKKDMSDELEKVLDKPVSDYLGESKQSFIQYYHHIFEETSESLKQHIKNQVNDYFDGMLSVLENKIDVQTMESIKTQIEDMIEQ